MFYDLLVGRLLDLQRAQIPQHLEKIQQHEGGGEGGGGLVVEEVQEGECVRDRAGLS